MISITTATFGNYRNGEYLQFMKNVIAIYGKYDTDALLLKPRVQSLIDATTTMDQVFMAATAHELTPELQQLDIRRDKALMGMKILLDAMTYKEDPEIIKSAQILQANYLSHGDRIDKLSYQQETAVVDALINDWNTTPSLIAAQNTLMITDWVLLLKNLNVEFNNKYIARSQTTLQPGQIDIKRTDMRNAYEDLTLDTISYSRVASNKSEYLSIIEGLNGLITDYNQAVTLRLAGRSTDTDTTTNDAVDPTPE